MSSTVIDNRSATQKATPESLLKQLRATAAVMCYDPYFGLPSMPLSEFQRKMFDMYNGNEDLNIVSQFELSCGGKGHYYEIYQTMQTLVTSTDARVRDNENSSAGSQLVLSPMLLNFDIHIRYVSCEHFSQEILQCPPKTLTNNRCSGRFLVDLSKQVVADMKKYSIIADEWLVLNDAPSGIV